METINLVDLSKPFPAEDIEWRVQSSGTKKSGEIWAKVLAYVTNRAIMDRLDDVCGPENWQNKFETAPNGGVLCGISIRCEHGWVTKWDGSDNTDIEAVKGGLSSSMKRAGSQWGIGRYLYKLTTGWAEIDDKGTHRDKLKDNTWFKWNPPQLPSWALPTEAKQQTQPQKRQVAPQATQADVPDFTPGQVITDLKKRLGAKMKGMGSREKVAFYSWLMVDKEETADMLQGFLDNYDALSSSYELSQDGVIT